MVTSNVFAQKCFKNVAIPTAIENAQEIIVLEKLIISSFSSLISWKRKEIYANY